MADQLALTKLSRSALTSNPNRAVRQQIPAFLNKLYSMVNDPANSELIRWSDEGDSFFVPNHERFGREVLPRFFKHGNFSSFVRQLNMYGFHKVPHLQQGVLQNDTETELWQFVNQHFQRGQPDLLMLIQRKKAGAPIANTAGDEDDYNGAGPSQGPGAHNQAALPSSSSAHPTDHSRAIDMSSIAQSLSAIKRHQSTISSDLKDLQQSNTALWQEAVAARERHKKHQDTINRILKFLAGVFGTAASGTATPGGVVRDHEEGDGQRSGAGSSRNGSVALVPRKRPRLMIEDSGAGNDIRPGPDRASQKNKAKSEQQGIALEDSDDAEWADEHLMVPMDITSPDMAQTSSAQIAEMHSPLETMENSPLFSDDHHSTARIESIASTPSTIVPPTPYPSAATLPRATTEAPNRQQNLALPTTPKRQRSSFSPSPSMSQAQTRQPDPPVYTSTTMPASANGSNIDLTQIDPTMNMNLSDQAAFQALLNSPTGLQRMMAALSQPGPLPNVTPAVTTLPQSGLPLPPPYMPYSTNGVLPNGSFDYAGGMFDGPQNQLITAGAGVPITTGYDGMPFPTVNAAGGYAAPVNGGGVTPEAMLALLSGPHGAAMDGLGGAGNNGAGGGPTDQELLNTLSSHNNALNRTYTDTTAINADVDALQRSINSLMDSMGVDPAMMARLHDNNSDSAAGNGTQLTTADGQNVDFDEFLNQFSQGPDHASGFSGLATEHSGDHALGQEEHGTSLDDMDTASSASTTEENIHTAEDVGVRPRRGKRKSSVNDVADAPQPSITSPRVRKSSRRK
ncbi:stress-responsive transcription factor hsf1 [Tulasnella sp. JGI-2019a]|nr:stress-responsive transcription factor hsf1 [Tulasnella sp. JGI-2019a]